VVIRAYAVKPESERERATKQKNTSLVSWQGKLVASATARVRARTRVLCWYRLACRLRVLCWYRLACRLRLLCWYRLACRLRLLCCFRLACRSRDRSFVRSSARFRGRRHERRAYAVSSHETFRTAFNAERSIMMSRA